MALGPFGSNVTVRWGGGGVPVIEPAHHGEQCPINNPWALIVSLLEITFREESHAQRNWFDMEVGGPSLLWTVPPLDW